MSTPDAPEPGSDDHAGEHADGGVSRNIQILAALIFAALVVVVAVVVIGGGKDTPNNVARDPSKPVDGVEATNTLLNGIPQHGLVLGNPDAAVTIVQFVDMQCPYCGAYENTEQPKVIKQVIRPGKAKLQLVPLAFIGPDSGAARNVLLRLSAKDRAFQFMNLGFLNQGTENTGYVSAAYLKKVVAAIPGTEPADADPTADATINAGRATADALGKSILGPTDGTPFFVVGPSSEDPKTYAQVDQSATPHAGDSVVAAVNRVAAKVAAG